MKKKGFTLVELLAVISILAILIIIAIPSVLKIFRQSKQNSFNNEVETIKTELKKEYMDLTMSGQVVPPVISSVGDYQLDMSGRDLDYYAELNRNGTIKYLEVTDGEFYYQYSEGASNDGEVVDLKDKDISVPSKIEYIKDNVAIEKIFVYDTLYDIYDSTNSVPVIITNSSDNALVASVYYGNTKLGSDVSIPAGSEDYMFFVKLTDSMVKSMQVNQTYDLKIDATINLGKNLSDDTDVIVKHNYANKIKVRRVNPGMIIKKIESTSNNDKIAFNQSGIFVPKGVNIGTLKVNVYNADNSKTYKFTNIKRQELKMVEAGKINNKKYSDIVITGEELLRYQAYLKNGEYIYSKDNYNIDMIFNSHINIQKIYFDFDVYINPGVYHNGNITIASKEKFNETKYGDFEIQNSSVSNEFHGNAYCKDLSKCFGTSGKLENVTSGELELGINKAILALDIAQSMSVQDTYSVYMTVEGSVFQIGQPASNYPATILAISEANTKYLSWIGFYDGYLQVYSYYEGGSKSGQLGDKTEPGFTSIPVSQFEGKIMNIQVTASRLGKTRVYINGSLIREFDSGGDTVSYKIATIGDLRPSRGLKFNGKIYDLALYNTELSTSAVNFNWSHAKNTWGIN